MAALQLAHSVEAGTDYDALGAFDAFNDTHDGERYWYARVAASYAHGELTSSEWAAYRTAYETGASKPCIAG